MTIRTQPELPWNVAGIAPEAREAARASARREGLSVGEWLTRRILQELGGVASRDEEAWRDSAKALRPIPETPAHTGHSADMLAHVSRSEGETRNSAGRIEEQLRNLARRLEQTERSQFEHGRAMTEAAGEISLVSREQVFAVDQLGAHILRLDERLGRIEQQTSSDTTREAIRALHLGLSRLADQMAETASRSAAQTAQLADSMEALIGKLAETREENYQRWQALEERVGALAANVGSIAGTLLESRDAAERAVHALTERVEAAEQSVVRLEETQGRHADHGTELQRHSAALVQLAESVETLTREFAVKDADAAHTLARIDAVEQRQREALAGLESRVQVVAARLDAACAAKPESPPHATPEAVESRAAGPREEPQTRAAAASEKPARPVGAGLESFFAIPHPAGAAGAARAHAAFFRSNPAAGERRTWLVLLVALAALVVAAVTAGLLLSRNVAQPAAVVSPSPPPALSALRPRPAKPSPSHARAASPTPQSRLAALANAGNPKAEELLGLEYADGEAQPLNEAEGAKWLERAALQGEAFAAWRLGAMYERGRGVPADEARAVEWYAKAAKGGNRKAMHNLAVAYASGTGTAKDMQAAAQWFARAASFGLADSQFNLAVLYERGYGVPQNLTEAYKWYAIAAAQGDAGAKERLAAVATQLRAKARAAADISAAAFRPEPLDGAANAPPTLASVVAN